MIIRRLPSNELYHHGILGQKWGVRRYQNKDGTLTDLGRSRLGIKTLEKRTMENAYKERRKNGGEYLFKSARISTGKNYENAHENFEKKVLNDPEYKDLSKKAFEAEKKRLLYEKKYFDPDEYDIDYDKFINSQEYIKLVADSKAAKRAKNNYVEKQTKNFVENELKDAKIKDMNITDKDIETVKKYISNLNSVFIWDGNLEFNYDNYYEPGDEDLKFK